MYVCMYVYTHTYIYIHIYIYIHTYVTGAEDFRPAVAGATELGEVFHIIQYVQKTYFKTSKYAKELGEVFHIIHHVLTPCRNILKTFKMGAYLGTPQALNCMERIGIAGKI